MKSKQIDFMFCRIKHEYTKKMETQLRKCYNDASGDRGMELTTVDLFDASALEARQFHFIFVLDESGSMSGQRFADLQTAYRNFIEIRRNSQGLSDFVSVVLFNNTARLLHPSPLPISSVPTTLPFRGGGTNFSAGLNAAIPMISQCKNTPIMIFMSDGGDGSPPSVSANLMRSIRNRFASKGFVAHSIAFGSGGIKYAAYLQGLATEGMIEGKKRYKKKKERKEMEERKRKRKRKRKGKKGKERERKGKKGKERERKDMAEREKK
jgi:hypothetical protein